MPSLFPDFRMPCPTRICSTALTHPPARPPTPHPGPPLETTLWMIPDARLEFIRDTSKTHLTDAEFDAFIASWVKLSPSALMRERVAKETADSILEGVPFTGIGSLREARKDLR